MLAFEDEDPESIGNVGETLLGIADIVATEEVGDVAWDIVPRSVAGSGAIDVDGVSVLLEDVWVARRDSHTGN